MLYWQLALAGVASGSIAALSGLGLVLTYRATGIFNFAQGAVAMIVAYIFWQTNIGWGWPLAISAIVAVLLVGPAVGIALERFVFRPLDGRRRRKSWSQRLASSS
jgi:branched-subunit amino acid ABC-type transport system permease component